MTRRAACDRERTGVTLVELLVVLAILGIMAGISGLALRAAPPREPKDTDLARVAAARREALRSGRPVLVALRDSGGPRSAFVLPDGSVVGDSLLAIDRLTGGPRDAAR
jgi:prepilin-type N-terminal cleavage/methylation domain-containing protein